MSTVYHFVTFDRETRADLFMGVNLDYIVKAIAQGKLRYSAVAEVDHDDVGLVFQLTNSIDQDWWANSRVTRLNPLATRSTSAGDIMKIGDHYVLCKGTGMGAFVGVNIAFHAAVFEALDNAKGNGNDYSETESNNPVHDLSAHVTRVALDMIEFCADFEASDTATLAPHIANWITYTRNEKAHHALRNRRSA